MDLIYTDSEQNEVGILTGFTLDYESSTKAGENTFEIQCALSYAPLSIGSLFYEEGSEIGGMVDSIKIDTSKQVAYYTGRTFRGILESKVICPDEGSDYYTASGSVTSILEALIERCALDGFFVVDDGASTSITFQFDRYTDLYTGIIKMLSKNGLKLTIYHEGNDAHIKAEEIVDYSTTQDMTSDSFDFVLETKNSTCNHLIGLGSGELSERMIVHRYLDAEGNVSSTQYFTGIDEITKTYDDSNCESEEDLIKTVEEQLLNYGIDNSLDVTSYDLVADLGDKFLAEEKTTGISVTEYVVKKISTLSVDGNLKTSYEVGEQIL